MVHMSTFYGTNADTMHTTNTILSCKNQSCLPASGFVLCTGGAKQACKYSENSEIARRTWCAEFFCVLLF